MKRCKYFNHKWFNHVASPVLSTSLCVTFYQQMNTWMMVKNDVHVHVYSLCSKTHTNYTFISSYIWIIDL